MPTEARRIAVFAPHPDDDLIGCGGSLAKRVLEGAEVNVVYLTSGEAGSLRYPKAELAKIRESEARAAAAELGITRVRFLGMEDGGVETNARNIKEFIRLVRDIKPDWIYAPHARDAHRDHMACFELVKEAVSAAAGPWHPDCGTVPWAVPTVLAYEVWTPLWDYAFVEDVTDTMDAKLRALEKHVSQVRDIDYVDAVRSFNRYRGVLTGRGRYCECFQVLRVGSLA